MVSFLNVFQLKFCLYFLAFPTWANHLILDLISLIILGEEHKLSSASYNFPHSLFVLLNVHMLTELCSH